MKIRLVHWPVNNAGGILTWVRAIRSGFESMGHEVKVICPVDYHPKDRVITKDDYDKGIPACQMLPMVSEREFSELMVDLNGADLVVFCHASPHPTKSQMEKTKSGRRWVDVYQNLTTPRVVVFHDNLWEKTNPWFADVAEHVPFVLAAQHLFMESAERYPTKVRQWAYFPIAVPPLQEEPRSGGLMATQWLGWKRHREFFTHLPALTALGVNFTFFNSGLEWHYLKNELPFETWIGEDKRLQYRGPVPHEELLTALRKAQFSVDYSNRGYTNYTHWEPLLCGAYSFVHEDVLRNAYCELPESEMVVPFDDTNIVEQIRGILGTNPVEGRRSVYDWCRERMDPQVICLQLLAGACVQERVDTAVIRSEPPEAPSIQPKPPKPPKPPVVKVIRVAGEQEQPNSIQIEFAQGCPLMCDFCGLNGMEHGIHLMERETLVNIADSMAALGWTSRIELAMHGEPTLNPEYVEFVEILRKRLPRNYIMMLTNGFGLQENARYKAARLFGAGLNCLGIEEYGKVTWAAEIEEQLIVTSDRLHYPSCGPEGNPHHRFMKARVVFIAPIDTEKDGCHSTLCNHCGAAGPLNDRQVGKRCARPFREMSIRWDGWVALCCNDFRGEFRVANTNAMPLGDIWQHPYFRAARRKLYRGQRDFVPCRGCDHQSYRSGLLPDKMGKESLPEADDSDVSCLEQAVVDGPLTQIVRRPWEDTNQVTN